MAEFSLSTSLPPSLLSFLPFYLSFMDVRSKFGLQMVCWRWGQSVFATCFVPPPALSSLANFSTLTAPNYCVGFQTMQSSLTHTKLQAMASTGEVVGRGKDIFSGRLCVGMVSQTDALMLHTISGDY